MGGTPLKLPMEILCAVMRSRFSFSSKNEPASEKMSSFNFAGGLSSRHSDSSKKDRNRHSIALALAAKAMSDSKLGALTPPNVKGVFILDDDEGKRVYAKYWTGTTFVYFILKAIRLQANPCDCSLTCFATDNKDVKTVEKQKEFEKKAHGKTK